MKITIFKFSLLFLMVSALMAFTPESKTKVGVDNGKKPIYMNTAYSFEERAADLVSRLTLEEKQTLIGNTMAPIPRLGIGAYQLENEACHGVMGGLFNPAVKSPTSFPNSAALGSSWDPALMEREATAIANEGRATNVNLIGLNYWAPVIEPARDPRWGRTGESFGEDPFLVTEIGGAFIRGMMGKDPIYLKTVPTAKHYFANNTELIMAGFLALGLFTSDWYKSLLPLAGKALLVSGRMVGLYGFDSARSMKPTTSLASVVAPVLLVTHTSIR